MEVTPNSKDEELMLAYREGNTSAFNELYGRYAGRVYSYLQKRVFDRTERDDLFQAIFLKLHKSRYLYDSKFQFAPWLFTICRTALLDFLKAKKPAIVHEPVKTSSIDSTLTVSETVNELSERQRSAIEMRYSEGLDFSEIADRLKISSTNARQLISRAVRKLRRDHG